MPEVHIPLQHGQHEDIDAKMLPQEAMLEVRNARLRKDNRYSIRHGYAWITGNEGQAIASGNLGPKRSVYIKARTSAVAPAKWFDRREDGTYSTAISSTSVGDLGVPRRSAVARNLTYGCLASDMVQVGSYIFAVYQDASYTDGTVSSVTLAIHEAIGGRLVQRLTVGNTTSVNPKITSSGNTVWVAWADTVTDLIDFVAMDATTLGSTSGSLAGASTGRGFAFDMAPLDSTRILLAYETSTINLRVVAISLSATTTVANQAITNPARPTVTLGATSGDVILAWAEGATFDVGNLYYRVDTITGSPVVAKVTRDNSGTVVGFPVIGPNATNDFTIAWINGANTLVGIPVDANQTIGWLAPACKPFIGPNNACLMWAVSHTSSGQTDQFATYKLVDLESMATLGTGYGPICEAVSCQREAMPGAYQTTTATYQTMIESRRFCVPVTTTLDQPGTTAFAALLPTLIAGGFGADIVRMDNGLYVDRLLPCNINGQLLFTGPRVREFDGSILYGSGLADGPEYVALSDQGAGGGTGGSVSIIVTYEWQDAQGRRHRSPPSVPQTISVAAGNKIGVAFSGPSFSDKDGGVGALRGVYAMVWRTLDNGSVYYLDNFTSKIPIPTFIGVQVSYTITSLDADVSAQEVLYTQGERGGASGLLANDEPPPCRYMWAGNDRVIMGGLEDPSAFRFSKLLFPGEPLQFTNDDAFKGHVDAEVTAVACMDGIWYVATRDSWFAVTGDGPDDMGNGFFAEPRRVSSVVGCVSHRSLVEIAEGLVFYARDGQMWLLPRGGGAPVFFGAAMRDTLSGHIILGAQYVRDENLVAWLAIDTAATTARIIIYDTRAGEWMCDYVTGAGVWSSPRRTLDVYDGKLVLDGQIGESAAFTDDHTGSNGASYEMVIQSGDVRPFGPNGYGRVRRAQILGEALATGNHVVTIQVSYDSGAFYSHDVASVPITATVGDPLQFDHLLKYPRGNAPSTNYSNSFRFKLISTAQSATVGTEAVAFNALSLEVYPERGLARQRAAMRV